MIALLLCCALLLGVSLLSGQAFAATNLFVAVNDTLPGARAYVSGGTYYVPYSVFNALGIYYSYLSDSSTALLYSGAAKCFFDLQNGGCLDENGASFSDSAISRGGTVYVPVYFVCNRFGLRCIYISGNEYGDILRIKNSAAVLDDKRFLEAAIAQGLLSDNSGGDSGSAPPPTRTPSPTPKPSPSPTPNKSAVRVRLCFEGLPDSGALALLDTQELRACFFVTANDVRQNADELRRIAGSGHKIGVLLDPADCAESFSKTADLLFEAAHIGTVLCAAPAGGDEAGSAFAAAQGLCFIAGDLALSSDLKAVTAPLSGRTGPTDIRVLCGDGGAAQLKDLLTYLAKNRFDLEPMREVG